MDAIIVSEDIVASTNIEFLREVLSTQIHVERDPFMEEFRILGTEYFSKDVLGLLTPKEIYIRRTPLVPDEWKQELDRFALNPNVELRSDICVRILESGSEFIVTLASDMRRLIPNFPLCLGICALGSKRVFLSDDMRLDTLCSYLVKNKDSCSQLSWISSVCLQVIYSAQMISQRGACIRLDPSSILLRALDKSDKFSIRYETMDSKVEYLSITEIVVVDPRPYQDMRALSMVPILRMISQIVSSRTSGRIQRIVERVGPTTSLTELAEEIRFLCPDVVSSTTESKVINKIMADRSIQAIPSESLLSLDQVSEEIRRMESSLGFSKTYSQDLFVCEMSVSMELATDTPMHEILISSLGSFISGCRLLSEILSALRQKRQVVLRSLEKISSELRSETPDIPELGSEPTMPADLSLSLRLFNSEETMNHLRNEIIRLMLCVDVISDLIHSRKDRYLAYLQELSEVRSDLVGVSDWIQTGFQRL